MSALELIQLTRALEEAEKRIAVLEADIKRDSEATGFIISIWKEKVIALAKALGEAKLEISRLECNENNGSSRGPSDSGNSSVDYVPPLEQLIEIKTSGPITISLPKPSGQSITIKNLSDHEAIIKHETITEYEAPIAPATTQTGEE